MKIVRARAGAPVVIRTAARIPQVGRQPQLVHVPVAEDDVDLRGVGQPQLVPQQHLPEDPAALLVAAVEHVPEVDHARAGHLRSRDPDLYVE